MEATPHQWVEVEWPLVVQQSIKAGLGAPDSSMAIFLTLRRFGYFKGEEWPFEEIMNDIKKQGIANGSWPVDEILPNHFSKFGKLGTHNQIFTITDQNGNDESWQYRGVSFFNALDLVSKGEFSRVNEFCKTFRELGYNTLRVFLYVTWPNVGWEIPSNEDVLKGILYLREQGFFVELVLLTDADISRTERVRNVIDFLAEKNLDNLLLEIENEPDIHKDDITELFRNNCDRSGYLYSNGRYNNSDKHFGSYITFHSSRSSDWPVKARGAQEFNAGKGPNREDEKAISKPVVLDEPIKPSEAPVDKRFLDYYTYGCISSAASGGATFHFENGKLGNLPTDDDLLCANFLIRGLKIYPLGSALYNLQYNRIVEGGVTLRTYEFGPNLIRVRPSNKECPKSGYESLDEFGIAWVRK